MCYVDHRHALYRVRQIGAQEITPTGSRVIGGARDDSDWDYLVLMPVSEQAALWTEGYERQWEPDGEKKTTSWRRGQINLIVTADRDTYDRWVSATNAAIAAKPATREERIAIFHQHQIGDDYAEESLHQHGEHAGEPEGRGEEAGGRSGAGDVGRVIDEAF